MIEYATLDENNNVVRCDLEAYRRLEDPRRFIKQEYYKGFWISTVFLFLDHSHDGSGIHFETYVFPAEEKDGKWTVSSWGEVWGERSRTYDESLAVHEKARKAIDDGEIVLPTDEGEVLK